MAAENNDGDESARQHRARVGVTAVPRGKAITAVPFSLYGFWAASVKTRREGSRAQTDCGDNIPMSKKGEAEEEAEYHYVSPGECPSVLEMLNSDKLLQNSIWLCIEIFHTNWMLAFID